MKIRISFVLLQLYLVLCLMIEKTIVRAGRLRLEELSS